MKFLENGKLYFKSDYSDIALESQENLALNIIKIIRSKENEILVTDEELNRENSYEIADKIEKFAKGLDSLNLEKNDIVGFITPNLIEYTYGLLGCILSGLVVSPINPNSTVDEIKNTLSTLTPKCLLIDLSNYNRLKKDFNQLFPMCSSIIVVNDKYKQPISNLESQLDNGGNKSFKIIDFNHFINNDGNYNSSKSIVDIKNDLAFILFSSGTTGNFKGVCLTHSNILHNIRQAIISNYAYLEPKQVVLCTLPLYHSFGLVVAFLSIFSYGGGFVLMKKYNTTKFLQLVQSERVGFAFIVPPIGVDLSKSPMVQDYDCTSLKSIFSGGAPFPIDIESLLKSKLGVSVDKNNQLVQGLVIRQGYGLSETSPLVTVSIPKLNKVGSSGTLVPNIVAKILDIESGRNLDSNQIGELCIKGPNVMKYYYNKERETKDTFDEEGFLLTGDMGYFDDDGCLFLVDRKKELIKCYGYQVAPAELESILLSHPKIKDSCVIGVKDERGGEVPRAFVVLKPNESLLATEIHEWFKSKVSHYKYLRGGIFFIDQIPKSPSGKILRKVLRSSL